MQIIKLTTENSYIVLNLSAEVVLIGLSKTKLLTLPNTRDATLIFISDTDSKYLALVDTEYRFDTTDTATAGSNQIPSSK